AMRLRRILFPHDGVLGEGCQYFISQQLFDSAVPTGDKVLMTRFLADFRLFQAALPKKISGVLNNFHCDIESVHLPPSFLSLIYKTIFLVPCQGCFIRLPASPLFATQAPNCGSSCGVRW